jgi:molecular chaperone DnaJ
VSSVINHYKTLKISPTATQAEIKQAYRRLVKIFHPDSHSSKADHEEIVRLNAAYEILGDAQRRQSYDRQFSEQSRTAITSRTKRQPPANTNSTGR